MQMEAYYENAGLAISNDANTTRWISNNVYGNTVLDIEGGLYDLHVPLAKEGKKVFAVLSEEQKVNQYTLALFEQERIIRPNIAYIYGGFLSHDFGTAKYDTIILSVWKDVVSAEEYIKKAVALLSLDNGRLIISMDLRTNQNAIPNFNSIFHTLFHQLSLESFDIYEDSFIRIVAVNRAGEQNNAQNVDLLTLVYDKLVVTFWNLFTHLSRTKIELEERLASADENEKKFVSELGTISKLAHDLYNEKVNIQSRADELNDELSAARDEAENLRMQLLHMQTKASELESRLKAAQAEAQRYARSYKEVLASKRYKAGNALAEIAGNPFRIFRYAYKAIMMLFRMIKKNTIKILRPVKRYLITSLRRLGDQLHKLKRFKFNGISVIIPTYKEIPYLDQCVNSVLSQTLVPSKIEIILSVNGKDEEYFEKLKSKYSKNNRVKVIYTPKVGLSAARNFALQHVTKDYVTFLDDDDYFTPGYLKEMTSHLGKDIQIVCGRLVDEYGSRRDNDTYINKGLSRIIGGGKTKDYLMIGSLFTPAWAKLYQTKLIRDVFCPFREEMRHTEDVLFWTDNFHKLTGYVYCCDANGKEALVRRVLDNSMSRPPRERAFTFGIEERIPIINTISERIYEPNLSVEQKRLLLTKINSQTDVMLHYFELLDVQMQKEAIDLIQSSENFFLNKSKFAVDKGIAFCHNFPPSADASAYVAAKRLPQIGDLEGKPIKWKVISSDMSNCRANDDLFYLFFASYIIDSHIILPKPSYFNEMAQKIFGETAFDCVKEEQVEYIYSRSLYAGSHDAAYLYKKKYPKVKWYAEFSDPVYMGTNDMPRPTAKVYCGDESFLNHYWRDVEQKVYELADVIIFTNEKQREYMLEYNEFKERNTSIMKRSIVMWHPTLKKEFCSIIPSDYRIDGKLINIGYFGTFYPNRQYSEMLELLKNQAVHLHFFVPNPDELKAIKSERVHVSRVVSHLEYLNIASKMDYLFMNDISFKGHINPYLPSKLADYLSSGSKIIALVKEGSVLSEFNDPNLIKTYAIDEDFANSLTKL